MSVRTTDLTGEKITFLVLLRLAIGWHFLYEGLVKVFNPNWSSLGYLLDSKGFLSEFFISLASKPAIMHWLDLANEWGLVLVGAGLLLGCFTRLATFAGMILVGLYYLSHPPFAGLSYALPSEGSYLVVNKNLIEFLALGVLLVFPTGTIVGIDRFIFGHPKHE